jgi:hypothetical protein
VVGSTFLLGFQWFSSAAMFSYQRVMTLMRPVLVHPFEVFWILLAGLVTILLANPDIKTTSFFKGI